MLAEAWLIATTGFNFAGGRVQPPIFPHSCPRDFAWFLGSILCLPGDKFALEAEGAEHQPLAFVA
jgi:hypothetical protein